MTSVALRRVLAGLTAGALLLGLAACGSSGHRDEGPRITNMTSSAGQREVLIRPDGAVAGLVVFMHGADEDRNQILDTTFTPVRNQLLAEHLAIVASDAHGDNMGNAASLTDQLLAVQDARARLGAVARVDILAFSMGGLDALLTASSHRLAGLQSVALLSPAVDQRPFLTGRFGLLIDKAFGYATPARAPALLRRFDPALQPIDSYRGYRYHFWHSPHDTTVPVAQSIVFSRMLAGAGVETGLSALTGNHGDLAALRPADVAALFTASSPPTP